MVLLLLIYCFMYFPLFMEVLCLSLFCYALHCVHSSFAIILKRKRKVVALLLLTYRCIVTVKVMWLFLTVPWVGLQCVILVFPDHTQFLFKRKSLLLHMLCMTVANQLQSLQTVNHCSFAWQYVRVDFDSHICLFACTDPGGQGSGSLLKNQKKYRDS